MFRSTTGRPVLAVLFAACGALAAPAGAQAASFFVDQSGSGTECTEAAPCATIALALAASRAAPGAGDRIEVGPGLYVERVVIDNGEDSGLTLHGAGRGPDQESTPAGATTVRAPETNKGPEVAVTNATSVSIEALRVEVPAGFVNSGGISLGAPGATARDVDVSSAGDMDSEGLEVDPGVPDTRVIDSRVRVSGSNRGVGIFGPRATVVGSDIRADQGMALDAEQTESPLVLRSRLTSEEGTVVATIRRTSHVLIESSLLLGGRFGIEAYASFGETSSVRLSNDTIDTGEPKVDDRFGLALIARAELEGTSSVVMVNTVALEKQEVSGTAAQSISCESSIVPTQTESGPTGTIDCGAANGNIDPAPSAVFVPGPDWHLAPGSAAIDSGTEVDPISEMDLDGNPRIADGSGDGTAVIDRGAYELPTPTHHVAAPPSNAFTFGKLKRDRRRGTAKLQVLVPGAGALALSGKKVKPASVDAAGPGTYSLAIIEKKGLARTLRSKESAKTSIRVTFTPPGGSANSMTRSVKLIRRAGRAR